MWEILIGNEMNIDALLSLSNENEDVINKHINSLYTFISGNSNITTTYAKNIWFSMHNFFTFSISFLWKYTFYCNLISIL